MESTEEPKELTSKQCPICEVEISCLKTHKRHHMIVMCKDCKVIMSLYKIQSHLCVNNEYHCSLCSYKTNIEKNYSYHVKSVHNPEQVKCHLCDQMFKNERLVMIHKAKAHDCRYPCHQCEKVFSLMKNLNRHIKKIHVNPTVRKKRVTKKMKKEHKCEFCPYKTKFFSNLKRHLRACRFKPRVPKAIGEDIFDVFAPYIMSNTKALGIIRNLKFKIGKEHFPKNVDKLMSKMLNQYSCDYESDTVIQRR